MTSLPLMVRPVEVARAIGQGNAMAEQTGALQQRNRLMDLYEQDGAAIFQGDQDALARLAQIDPVQATGIQHQRQTAEVAQQNLELRREEGRRAAQAIVAEHDAATVEQERAEAAAILARAIPALQSGDLAGANQALAAAGYPPAQSLDELRVRVAENEGAMEIFESMQTLSGQPAGHTPDWVTIDGQLIDRAAPGGPAAVPVQGLQTPTETRQPDWAMVNGQLVDRNAAGGPAVVPIAGLEQTPEPQFRPATAEEAQARGYRAGQFGPDGRFYAIGEAIQPASRDIRNVDGVAHDFTVYNQTGNIEDIIQLTEPRERGALVNVNMGGEDGGLPPAAPVSGQAPIEGADLSFGIGGALRGLANTGADAVGLSLPYPEVNQAQADMRVLGEDLLAQVAAGYSRQPPSWLLQAIRDLIPQPGQPFRGAETAASQYRALRAQFERQVEAEQNERANAVAQSDPDAVAEYDARIAALQGAISSVDAALAGLAGDGGGTGTTSGGVQWRIVE